MGKKSKRKNRVKKAPPPTFEPPNNAQPPPPPAGGNLPPGSIARILTSEEIQAIRASGVPPNDPPATQDVQQGNGSDDKLLYVQCTSNPDGTPRLMSPEELRNMKRSGLKVVDDTGTMPPILRDQFLEYGIPVEDRRNQVALVTAPTIDQDRLVAAAAAAVFVESNTTTTQGSSNTFDTDKQGPPAAAVPKQKVRIYKDENGQIVGTFMMATPNGKGERPPTRKEIQEMQALGVPVDDSGRLLPHLPDGGHAAPPVAVPAWATAPGGDNDYSPGRQQLEPWEIAIGEMMDRGGGGGNRKVTPEEMQEMKTIMEEHGVMEPTNSNHGFSDMRPTMEERGKMEKRPTEAASSNIDNGQDPESTVTTPSDSTTSVPPAATKNVPNLSVSLTHEDFLVFIEKMEETAETRGFDVSITNGLRFSLDGGYRNVELMKRIREQKPEQFQSILDGKKRPPAFQSLKIYKPRGTSPQDLTQYIRRLVYGVEVTILNEVSKQLGTKVPYLRPGETLQDEANYCLQLKGDDSDLEAMIEFKKKRPEIFRGYLPEDHPQKQSFRNDESTKESKSGQVLVSALNIPGDLPEYIKRLAVEAAAHNASESDDDEDPFTAALNSMCGFPLSHVGVSAEQWQELVQVSTSELRFEKYQEFQRQNFYAVSVSARKEMLNTTLFGSSNKSNSDSRPGTEQVEKSILASHRTTPSEQQAVPRRPKSRYTPWIGEEYQEATAPFIKPRPQLTDEEACRLDDELNTLFRDRILVFGEGHVTSLKGIAVEDYFFELHLDPEMRPMANRMMNIFMQVGSYAEIEASERVQLLIQACSWKFLRSGGYWPAKSELVDLLLKVGAEKDVNYEMHDGSTPLFAAVAYGDIETVELLLAAGANIHHTNKDGNTCFKAAIGACQPAIVERLLQELSADQLLFSEDWKTPVAYLLEFMIAENLGEHWSLHGPPSPQDLCAVMTMLRQGGGTLTAVDTTALYELGKLFHNGFVSSETLNCPESFKALAPVLVGETIPTGLCPNPMEGQRVHSLESKRYGPCQICSGSSRKSVRLYCHHEFCRKCIVRYGREHSACPVCSAELCLDIKFPHSKPAEVNRPQIYSHQRKHPYGRPHLPKFDMFGANPDLPRPFFGACAIDVTINYIAILAYVCNCNMYTMISKNVVENLQLKRNHALKSKAFVNSVTREEIADTTFTCLEPFAIKIGHIEVILTTAVEVDPPPFPLFGIQLGYDFLSSGRSCKMVLPTGVVADNKLIYSEVGHTGLVQQLETDEAFCASFSYDAGESESNSSTYVPLHQFDPFGATNHGFALKHADLSCGKVRSKYFDVCYWCNRAFPRRMLVCECCDERETNTTYCSPKCQKTARKIHRKRMAATEESMEDID